MSQRASEPDPAWLHELGSASLPDAGGGTGVASVTTGRQGFSNRRGCRQGRWPGLCWSAPLGLKARAPCIQPKMWVKIRQAEGGRCFAVLARICFIRSRLSSAWFPARIGRSVSSAKPAPPRGGSWR